jgi:hypothetical protein
LRLFGANKIQEYCLYLLVERHFVCKRGNFCSSNFTALYSIPGAGTIVNIGDKIRDFDLSNSCLGIKIMTFGFQDKRQYVLKKIGENRKLPKIVIII